MIEITDGVWLLTGFPRHVINVYLVGDILIDAGTRWRRRRLLRQLRGRCLRLLALTHCHPDHQGAATAICQQFGVPLACHERDVPAMEGRAPMLPHSRAIAVSQRLFAGPPHSVAQLLHDGDVLDGWRVLHMPGHTPGHVIFFRDSDRTAIVGDVLANIHFITLRPGLRQPPAFFSADPEKNRQSIRRLLELQPQLICFGHGPPLRDANMLKEFVERLPPAQAKARW